MAKTTDQPITGASLHFSCCLRYDLRMSNFLNVAVFYISWFGIILGARAGSNALPLSLTALSVFIFLLTSINRKLDLELVAISSLFGVALDYIVVSLGVFQFSTPPLWPNLEYPLWMVCMWIIFGTTLQRSLLRVVMRPKLGALFGALGGPLSYMAAEALKVLTIAQPHANSLLILGVEWLAVMLIFYFLVRCRVNYTNAHESDR